MRKNIKNYSLLVVALASISIGSSAMVYAKTSASSASSSQTESTVPSERKEGGRDHKGGFGLGQSSLESLVSNGTIDQATADKIIAFRKAQQASREEEKAKIDAMTEDERKDYFSNKKEGQKGDPFSDIVSEGIITWTQADAIKAAMPEHKEEGRGEKRGFGFLENNLAGLVSAGTIDQNASDKITAYLNNLESEREAERTKVEAMTETEKQEYFSSNHKKEKVDLFANMVNEGIITQAEADAIKAAMPEKPCDNPPTASDTVS
ncbi:hypothetical protein [Lacrimispora aerotolerans]|uniref:hypothetical protein n=1 Tax=Lacrimispora aerotolerans TaxID=36832 RepID=UPI00047C5931|nr:hypothetical protein [Lacrimispora aerotolerans]